MIAAFSSSSRFGHCYHLRRSHIAKRRSLEEISWSFSGLFSYHLGIRRFRTLSGSCSVRDRARVLHNTSWSTDKPDQEEGLSSVLPYDCSLPRSLARSLHVLLLFFTATTHASGSSAKERPYFVRNVISG